MKSVKRNILSSQLTLKFSNKGKLESIGLFIDEYKRVVKELTNRYYDKLNVGDVVSPMPGKNETEIDTWLIARAIQAAAKQASGIANGAFTKNKRREYQAAKFDKDGQHKKARKLRDIINKNKVGKPFLKHVEAQLDSRFFTIETSKTSKGFDCWLILRVIKSNNSRNCEVLKIPLKFHKHYNKLIASGGIVMNSIRLSKTSVMVSFEMPIVNPVLESSGKTIGIDIGQTSIYSISTGEQIKYGNHGYTLKDINNIMSVRRKGGKGFKRSETHMKNFIGESVNKLNFQGISKIKLEKIQNMKKGRKTSKALIHWSASRLLDAVKHKASLLGVQVEEVNPMFTSQRCACCGWVQKANRKGELFVCRSCGNTGNADVNGSINISLDLPLLPKAAREQRWNRKGFFWKSDRFIQPPADEFIVRQAQKPKKLKTVNKRPKISQ
jgi:IS605 OrfB family transposase